MVSKIIGNPLNQNQRRTLSILCDTIIPSIKSTELKSQDSFFQRSATSIGVGAEIERILAEEFTEEQLAQIKRLLDLFQSRFQNFLLNMTTKTFSELNEEKRQKYLFEKFSMSSIALKRIGFQAVKRLVCFVNYGFVPKDLKLNPNWENIGYKGRVAENSPPTNIELMQIVPQKQDDVFNCDVCVVGSGAGGSIFAHALSKLGWNVLVVESGEYVRDFSGQEYEMTGRLFEQRGRATTEDLSISLLEGRTAGGSTTINWNTSIKPSNWLREEWEKEDGISDLTTNKFDSYIDFVWGMLGVNRDESQFNQNNGVLSRGCEKLGYSQPEDYEIIYRNAIGCNQRCTYCSYGCPYGSKQSTMKSLLPEAQSSGTRFVFDSEVEHVLVANGRAVGIRAYHKKSQYHFEVKCKKAVVIAAGSINTPAILLRSGLKKNVGANLRLHPTTALSGLYDHPVLMWEGPPQTVRITKGLNFDGNHNGYWIEAAPAHPALFASAAPWTSGRNHKQIMIEMQNATATIILVRDTGSGTVSIDKHGRAVCRYRMNQKDKDHMIEGMVEAARVLIAAGAKRVSTLHSDGFEVGGDGGKPDLEKFESGIRSRGIVPNKISLFSAHIMGSARMGREDVSFCDDSAQSYELPGLFIGDACVLPSAPGINPMITIMSVAKRNSERMHEIISKR